MCTRKMNTRSKSLLKLAVLIVLFTTLLTNYCKVVESARLLPTTTPEGDSTGSLYRSSYRNPRFGRIFKSTTFQFALDSPDIEQEQLESPFGRSDIPLLNKDNERKQLHDYNNNLALHFEVDANPKTSSHLQSQQSDADALCAFKQGIANWPGNCNMAGWNCNSETTSSTTYPCGPGNVTWTGILCSQSVVSQLDLSGCGFLGTINSQISLLTGLTLLWLRVNSLTGNMPSQISALTNMVSLNLRNNFLSGQIPSQLSTLIGMNQLFLYSNRFSGAIPSHLSALGSNLQYFSLNTNRLTGSIPSQLSALSNLIDLNLYSNCLTGFVPSQLSALGPNLQYFQLDSNRLMGPVPSQLSALSNLIYFSMYSNSLTGSIPPQLSALGSNLQRFQLHMNSLTGSIPSQLSALSNLIYLNLYSNSLTGLVPSQLSALGSNLQRFQLQMNRLTGSIPSQLSALSKVNTFSMYSNSLSGTVPSQLSALGSNLQYLQLQMNRLTGSIPSQLSALSNLIYFCMHSNSLTGYIPPQLSALGSKLRYFTLYMNSLTGPVPSQLSALSNLIYFSLSSNNLTSAIPLQLSALSNLIDFSMHTNSLTGSIPPQLSTLGPNLQYFQLQMNRLAGPVPSQLSALSNLIYFSLYSNSLTGSLPSQLSALGSNLQRFQLYMNRLTGSIPSQLSALSNLDTFSMHSNSLTGSVPSQLSALGSKLQDFELHMNRLTGSIPSQLSAFSNLDTFSMHSNSLTGSIPSQLSALSSLIYLYLSSNSLSGTISSQLSAVGSSNLKYFQLQINRLTGSIPSQLSALGSNLQVFQLSSNSLTGSIPLQLSALGSNLQFFQLDTNSLTCSIPSQLSALTGITHFNLYFNCLTGSIPSQLSKLGSNLQYFQLDFNRLTGNIPFQLSELKFVQFMSFTYNRLTSAIPVELCSLPSAALIEFTNNDFSCYPFCNRNAQWYIDPIPHCHNSSQDQVMCAISEAFDMPALMNNLEMKSPNEIIFESPHNRFATSDQVYTIEISNIRAYAYEITFSARTTVDYYDYILICSDSSCDKNKYPYFAYGTDNSLFPGVLGNKPLRIEATSFYMEAGLMGDFYSSYGFTIYVAPYTYGLGWDCSKDSDGLYYAKGLCDEGDSNRWTGVECVPNSYVAGLSLATVGLEGSIPSYFRHLNNLTILDLSFNRLSGSIPTFIESMVDLQSLDLSNNELFGKMIDFLTLPDINLISLSNNYLTGRISESLLNISSLRTLRLGANSFDGHLSTTFCTVDNNTLTLSISGNDDLCYPDCWISSNPSDNNGACETAEASKVKKDQMAVIVGTSVGGFALMVIICSIYYNYFRRGKYVMKDEAKRKRLEALPIHCLLVLEYNYSEEELNDVIMNNLKTVKELDLDDRTAIDLLLEKNNQGALEKVNVKSLYKMAECCLPFDSETGELLDAKNWYGWSTLVQSEDTKVMKVVSAICNRWKSKKYIDLLANCKDISGRKSIDIAKPLCKEILQKKMFLYERYELVYPPEHTSDSSVVHFAIDHGVKEGDFNRHVALKFMNVSNQFKKELDYRKLSNFARDFVVNVISDYQYEGSLKSPENYNSFDVELGIETDNMSNIDDPQLEDAGNQRYQSFGVAMTHFQGDEKSKINRDFREDSIMKGFDKYPYCLVMPNAGHSLFKIVSQNKTTAVDWDYVRLTMKSLFKCLDHIHSAGIVHGDLKPFNIMCKDTLIKLIDFDASVSSNNGESMTSKFSSAYIPPEMFSDENNFDSDNASGGSAVVAASRRDYIAPIGSDDCKNDFPVVKFNSIKGSHHFDMWSLGTVMYFLCTGGNLVHSDKRDNVMDVDDMKKIRNWSNTFKAKILSKVSDRIASNLLSILLSKVPSQRFSAKKLLNHPFITGNRATTRLAGGVPEFDVFLSYRVDSDAGHAKAMYEALTKQGLNVWWDAQCLPPGKNWEKGFVSGLVNSATFVCLLSREAINSPTNDKRNISKLSPASLCDNVVLEGRLAKELYDMGMINGIFPVLIGDKDPATSLYSDYFLSGCHPILQGEVVVTSVENKLVEYLEKEGLGYPLVPGLSLKSLLKNICDFQGQKIGSNDSQKPDEKNLDKVIVQAVDKIVKMVKEAREKFEN